MSHHRRPGSPVTTAHWLCAACNLSTSPAVGPSAAAETELLAIVHDRVHHRGARTAELRLVRERPTLLAAAS